MPSRIAIRRAFADAEGCHRRNGASARVTGCVAWLPEQRIDFAAPPGELRFGHAASVVSSTTSSTSRQYA
jgi:hypothetical protein